MILDYKQFYPRKPLRDNLLIVLEQLPGQVMWTDKTDALREDTYWSSYNIAYLFYLSTFRFLLFLV